MLMDEAYFKLAVWLNDKGMFIDTQFRILHFTNITKAISFSLHAHIAHAAAALIQYYYIIGIYKNIKTLQKIIDFNRNTKII